MQKFLEFTISRQKKKRSKIIDSYQESLNKLGREQFLKIVNRGFSRPVGRLSI